MGLLDLLVKVLSSPTTQKVVKHVQDNKAAYIAGTAAVAGTATAYAVGKSKGHTEGKKEGTAEQAARDERKFQQQKAAHESDRQEWERVSKEKDDLINDMANDLE